MYWRKGELISMLRVTVLMPMYDDAGRFVREATERWPEDGMRKW